MREIRITADYDGKASAPAELLEFVVEPPAGVAIDGSAEDVAKAQAAHSASPSLGGMARRYASALSRWIAAGRPARSRQRIDEVLAICKTCPHYREDGGRPRCGLCGCSVNSQPGGVANKIAMATESCPDDPPRWEAEA